MRARQSEPNARDHLLEHLGMDLGAGSKLFSLVDPDVYRMKLHYRFNRCFNINSAYHGPCCPRRPCCLQFVRKLPSIRPKCEFAFRPGVTGTIMPSSREGYLDLGWRFFWRNAFALDLMACQQPSIHVNRSR